MRKAFGIVLALVLVAAFGMTGCKNTCQKAADHMMGCIKTFCADHSDNTRCAEEQINTLETMLDAVASECPDQMAQESGEALNQSCDEILVEMGFQEPPSE